MKGLYMFGRIIPNANIPIRIKPPSMITINFSSTSLVVVYVYTNIK